MKVVLFILLALLSATATPFELEKGSRVVLVGNGLGSRMIQFSSFETLLHLQHPEKNLFIRNMCDEGNTPGFRPHSARSNPWAFPGAEKFHPPLSKAKDRWGSGHTGTGSMPTPDEWLTQLKPDIIIAFFGYNESFQGQAGLENFKAELRAWIKHTKSQKYNGTSAPRIALVSPTTFEHPDAAHKNKVSTNLILYTQGMDEIARAESVIFSNLSGERDPFNLNSFPKKHRKSLLKPFPYTKISRKISTDLFGTSGRLSSATDSSIYHAVREKNWHWEKYYKIPNGVHVYGRRHNPFGPKNYPAELKKLEQMTTNRDQAIWSAAQGKSFDLAAADAKTITLPEIKTNYRPSHKNGTTKYLYGAEALASFTTA
ncbi:SGNH/GDSL hydrolase family protein, partial [Akkermansiaceae bacterium]|nr:SGNH/GDSL hydrolase family protein [Akkermansiaceae bacterium]